MARRFAVQRSEAYDLPAMAKIDPVKESQRLADIYGSMEDSELAEIAADAASLTEIARKILNAELVRRGMQPLPENSPDSLPVENERPLPEPVMIRRYRDLPEASIAQSMLDSAGIESFLADDNLVRLDWFISNLVGGVKIFVRQEDAEAATKLLDQGVPEKFELENLAEYQQPRCPNCQSLDVSFDGLYKPATYAALFVGLPIPIKKKGWSCNSCGHRWEEASSPIAPEQQP
jgi:hypothetical protein